MKITSFEMSEKSAGRAFSRKIKDEWSEAGMTRTIRTSETLTSPAGEKTVVKTVKVIEYELGEPVSDPETIVTYDEPLGCTRPAQAASNDSLVAVKMSADAVVKIISDKFDEAIDSALAADPVPVETVKAEYPPYDFDSAIDAALDSVKIDPVSETDESELRKAILAQSSVNEPVTETVRPVAAQVVDTPVASPVASPAAEPEKKKPFRLADIPDPKQVPYDEAVKELRRQREAKAAEREAEEAKRAQEVLNSAFATTPVEHPKTEKRAPTDAEVMDGLEP